jgi:rubredoxin
MTSSYHCKNCGFFGVGEDEEPIIRLSFYNPHRRKCPECSHQMVGERIGTDCPSITD